MSSLPDNLWRSYNCWKREDEATFACSERAVLSQFLNFGEKQHDGRPRATQSQVRLSPSAACINTVEVLPPAGKKPSTRSAIVFLHGYGSGLGLFAKNLAPLVGMTSTHRVLAIDWLGMARSSRLFCEVEDNASKTVKAIQVRSKTCVRLDRS